MKELAKALSAFQGQLKHAPKSAENPFFKSHYADLASVWDTVRAPLCAHGLSVVQTTEIDDAGGVVLVTTLLHASGESMVGRMPLRPVKPEPQALGSAITYGRRYALMAILGVATEDDDGNEASAPAARQYHVAKDVHASPARPAPAVISREQVVRWHAIRTGAGVSEADGKSILADLGFGSSADITADKYEEACERVRRHGALEVPTNPKRQINQFLAKKIAASLKTIGMSELKASVIVGRTFNDVAALTQPEGEKLWAVLEAAAKGDSDANETVRNALDDTVPF